MMQLAERFVSAMENIAVNLQVLANPPVTVTAASPALTGGGTQAPAYKDMDRDVLLELCKQREIEVPPRTKTTTLVTWLENDDAVRNAGGAGPGTGSADAETKEPGGGQSDPSGEQKTEGEDPFSAETDGEDPFADAGSENPVTRDQVLDVLQKVQAAEGKGNPAVIRILQEAGGVAKLKDLPEDKYAAVFAAAQKEVEA